MQENDIARGDLFYLWHPNRDSTFSGYGLAVETGRKDLLAGILMVDRPYPVSEIWLASVEQTFGGCTLYAMTATHERGMACRLRVGAGSLPYVRRLDNPMVQPLRQALLPLLAHLPKPRFVVRWDSVLALWESEFDLEEGHSPLHATKRPLFPLGQIVATPGALAALQAAGAAG